MGDIQFSVDRPFGVYLYGYFDQLYAAVMGKSADTFAFVEGETPLSTTPEGTLLSLPTQERERANNRETYSADYLRDLPCCHFRWSVPFERFRPHESASPLQSAQLFVDVRFACPFAAAC